MGKYEKLNPIYWIKRLNEKFAKFEKIGYEGLFELATDLQDDNSRLHCQKCSRIMPMFRILVIAKSYEKGDVYFVKCPHCGFNNKVVKGDWENNQELQE